MVKKLFKTIVIYTINTLNGNSIFSTQVERNQIFTSNNGWEFEESMKLTLIDNLPFVTVTLTYRGRTIQIDSVLIDTGSATTILSVDDVASIDIYPSPEDRLYTIRGVGGNEVVFSRVVDQFRVGDQGISGFEVEIGGDEFFFGNITRQGFKYYPIPEFASKQIADE